MKIFIAAVLTLTAMTGFAGDPKYPVSAIPENLKANNYAVIRENTSQFNILAKNRSSHYEYIAVTILNPQGKKYASQYMWYDKLRKVNFVRGNVYDAQGNLVRKIKANDIIDQSAYDGFSLFSDNRIKEVDLSNTTYPYTIEFEYEVEMKYLYSIPDFFLYNDDEVSTQKTTYSITYPPGLAPRFRLNNIKDPVKSVTGDKETLSWTFENILPEKFESFGPVSQKIIPNVIAGPSEFEYEGYPGKMDTWEELGKWQILLNEGRDLLPDLTKAKVREITGGLASEEEKVKALYTYLQNKTRYVGIQRGIGGFQPFEAKVVDQLGYGDCKALSNYMVALLKEAGIKGYYTQIYAGDDERPIPPDFTVDYFNHIIVVVPVKKDTLWLECTSQTNPFGYLGKSTCDRYALMITESGGKLVRTPSYPAEKNVQSRQAEVHVLINGDATAKVKTVYNGLLYETGGVGYYADAQYDDQKKWVQKNTGIPSFDINSFSMKSRKEKLPAAVVEVDLTLKRFATTSGKRLFLTPNLMNRSSFIPDKTEKRKTNVVRTMAYITLDTIHYHVPEEIYPEFLPEPVKLRSRFGEYDASFTVEQGRLIYIRRVKIFKGEFPPESYAELIDFYKGINKADNMKLVFLNKT
jgi:transglutaminase-like putative cysteine protease